jgi:hypothetical protein
MKSCPACDALHEDSTTKCEKCGTRLTGVENYRRIDSHLAEAILVTVFCCPPFGLFAIIDAAQARDMLRRGDFQNAARASDSAKFWVKVSFWLGFVVLVIWMFIELFSGGFG